jgi:hypothetical protein
VCALLLCAERAVVPILDARLDGREQIEHHQEQGPLRQEELMRCIVDLLACPGKERSARSVGVDGIASAGGELPAKSQADRSTEAASGPHTLFMDRLQVLISIPSVESGATAASVTRQ